MAIVGQRPVAREAPSAVPAAAERGRRRIVAMVFVVYLLLIFEGSLRKWVAPSYSQYLFFVRDPVVLAIYIYTLVFAPRWWPRGTAVFQFGMGLAVIALLLGAAQLGSGSSGAGTSAWAPILAAYGWRNYFFYLPFAFLVGGTFRREDLERLVRLTCLIAVPMAVLVFIQFASPPGAAINVGISEDASQQFVGLAITGDHTRPAGTFTSDLGNKHFAVSALAMVLALWTMPQAMRFVKRWQLVIVTPCVLTCLALSGSRGAVLHSGFVMAAAIAAAVVIGRAGTALRAFVLPVLLGFAALVVYPVVYPEGYQAFAARWADADQTESAQFQYGVFGRALYAFYDFASVLGDVPIIGFGLGLAGNAQRGLGLGINGFSLPSENDWPRHIVELGPLVGVLYILFRIWFVAWLGQQCVAATRRSGNPLPMLLFGYLGVEFLYGLLTGQGQVNGFCWFYAGICIAATRLERPGAPAAETWEAPRARFAHVLR